MTRVWYSTPVEDWLAWCSTVPAVTQGSLRPAAPQPSGLLPASTRDKGLQE